MTAPRYRAMLAGETVKRGQAITDFRGAPWIFAYVTNSPVSFGKIVVSGVDGSGEREFFPSVFPALSIEPIPSLEGGG